MDVPSLKILKQDEHGRDSTTSKVPFDQRDLSNLYALMSWIKGYEDASGKTVPGKYTLKAVYMALCAEKK